MPDKDFTGNNYYKTNDFSCSQAGGIVWSKELRYEHGDFVIPARGQPSLVSSVNHR